MGDYLEAEINSCSFSHETTKLSLKDAGLRDIVFNLPFILRLIKGDKLHFLHSIPKHSAGVCILITHDNYKDVEITRKDENNYFLKLNAKDMRLLENVKKDYIKQS